MKNAVVLSETSVKSISMKSSEDFPAPAVTACTKMAEELGLTHFQAGFSPTAVRESCYSEETQDSVSRSVYSQRGGAGSTADPALGCGKELHGKDTEAAHRSRLEGTTLTHQDCVSH